MTSLWCESGPIWKAPWERRCVFSGSGGGRGLCTWTGPSVVMPWKRWSGFCLGWWDDWTGKHTDRQTGPHLGSIWSSDNISEIGKQWKWTVFCSRGSGRCKNYLCDSFYEHALSFVLFFWRGGGGAAIGQFFAGWLGIFWISDLFLPQPLIPVEHTYLGGVFYIHSPGKHTHTNLPLPLGASSFILESQGLNCNSHHL